MDIEDLYRKKDMPGVLGALVGWAVWCHQNMRVSPVRNFNQQVFFTKNI
jgi:hypothetical protein